jgi:hypothetical protein
MKGMVLVAAAWLAVSGASAALAQSSPPGTVNSYSAAEEQRARAAAQREGFTPIGRVWAQAGTFFLYATKDGNRHQLTVTPQGVVHATGPVPRTHPAYNS